MKNLTHTNKQNIAMFFATLIALFLSMYLVEIWGETGERFFLFVALVSMLMCIFIIGFYTILFIKWLLNI